jgi:hypothetical protein
LVLSAIKLSLIGISSQCMKIQSESLETPEK